MVLAGSIPEQRFMSRLQIAEMYARRRDKTHSPICDQLRAIGFSVLDLGNVGRGCPDALIGRHGFTLLVEFKTGSEKNYQGRATGLAQHEFAKNWKGCPVIRASTLKDVLDAFNQLSDWSRSSHVGPSDSGNQQ